MKRTELFQARPHTSDHSRSVVMPWRVWGRAAAVFKIRSFADLEQNYASAIIAVKLHSVAILSPSIALPANLQTRERFCVNSTCRSNKQPGSTGVRNFASSMAMK